MIWLIIVAVGAFLAGRYLRIRSDSRRDASLAALHSMVLEAFKPSKETQI